MNTRQFLNPERVRKTKKMTEPTRWIALRMGGASPDVPWRLSP